jgi:hypothetical protein
MLAFAAVHRQLHGVAIGSMEGFVFVENDLEEIVAHRNIVEKTQGVAIGRVIENDGLPGLESINIEAEKQLGSR